MADEDPSNRGSFRVPAAALDPLSSSDVKTGAILGDSMAAFEDDLEPPAPARPEKGRLLIDVRVAGSMFLCLLGVVILLATAWFTSPLLFMAVLGVVVFGAGVVLGFTGG